MDLIEIEIAYKKSIKEPSLYELVVIYPTAIGTIKRCLAEDIRLLKIAIECNEVDNDPFGSGELLKSRLNKKQLDLRYVKGIGKEDAGHHISSAMIDQAKQSPISHLIRVGRDHKVVCLFHHDTHASMHVYDDKSYYCFACQAHGTTIDIVMRLYGLNFSEAVRKLNNI